MQVLSFSMSKENYSTASIVFLFVLETRVKKPGGQLGMISKWEKPFYNSGMKMMKFGKEEYQMLLLSIDGKIASEINYNPFLLKIR